MSSNGFVADGHRRAAKANELVVRAAVEQQFATELAAASMFERMRLGFEMERQIREQLAALLPPPDALY